MRFLLIAPTEESVMQGSEPNPAEKISKQQTRFAAERLTQRWVDLDASARPIAGTEIESTKSDTVTQRSHTGPITRAAVATSRNTSVLVLDVTLEVERRGKFSADQATAVGRQLEAIADEFVSNNPAFPKLRWVARVAVIAPDDHLGECWDGNAAQRIPIAGGLCEAIVGWGNCSILLPDSASDELWQEISRGLVDAQVMWVDVFDIGQEAGISTDRMLLTNRKRSDVSAFLDRVAEFMKRNAVHNLAYDDLLTGMQGPRREIAEATLDSWGYHGIADRVARRLKDLDDIGRREEARRSAKYQRIVEGTLFALACVTVIELAFSIISTAYSGNVSSVPGDGSFLHFFDAVRATNADVFVVLAAVVLLTIATLLWRAKRR